MGKYSGSEHYSGSIAVGAVQWVHCNGSIAVGALQWEHCSGSVSERKTVQPVGDLSLGQAAEKRLPLPCKKILAMFF